MNNGMDMNLFLLSITRSIGMWRDFYQEKSWTITCTALLFSIQSESITVHEKRDTGKVFFSHFMSFYQINFIFTRWIGFDKNLLRGTQKFQF